MRISLGMFLLSLLLLAFGYVAFGLGGVAVVAILCFVLMLSVWN